MTERVHRRLPIQGQSITEDQLIGMILALTSEIAVLRERLDTVERVSVAAGSFDRGAVDRFVPDAAAQIERDTMRTRLIGRVLRPVRDALELAAGDVT